MDWGLVGENMKWGSGYGVVGADVQCKYCKGKGFSDQTKWTDKRYKGAETGNGSGAPTTVTVGSEPTPS